MNFLKKALIGGRGEDPNVATQTLRVMDTGISFTHIPPKISIRCEYDVISFISHEIRRVYYEVDKEILNKKRKCMFGTYACQIILGLGFSFGMLAIIFEVKSDPINFIIIFFFIFAAIFFTFFARAQRRLRQLNNDWWQTNYNLLNNKLNNINNKLNGMTINIGPIFKNEFVIEYRISGHMSKNTKVTLRNDIIIQNPQNGQGVGQGGQVGLVMGGVQNNIQQQVVMGPNGQQFVLIPVEQMEQKQPSVPMVPIADDNNDNNNNNNGGIRPSMAEGVQRGGDIQNEGEFVGNNTSSPDGGGTQNGMDGNKAAYVYQ